MATTSDSTDSSPPQHKFTVEDADRLLQLGDQFLEDWEENESKDDPDCHERRAEWDAIRPLLAAAPDLLKACKAAEDYGWSGMSQAVIDQLRRAIVKAEGGSRISAESIIVHVEGGMVQDVTGIPPGVEVRVEDYDHADDTQPTWDAEKGCHVTVYGGDGL
jgi:hypothetical protein